MTLVAGGPGSCAADAGADASSCPPPGHVAATCRWSSNLGTFASERPSGAERRLVFLELSCVGQIGLYLCLTAAFYSRECLEANFTSAFVWLA